MTMDGYSLTPTAESSVLPEIMEKKSSFSQELCSFYYCKNTKSPLPNDYKKLILRDHHQIGLQTLLSNDVMRGS